MELGKPSLVSYGAWIAIIAIGIYMIYVATHKGNDTENYTKGAAHNETTINISPVANYYPLSIPGCSPFVRLDNPVSKGTVVPVTETKVKK